MGKRYGSSRCRRIRSPRLGGLRRASVRHCCGIAGESGSVAELYVLDTSAILAFLGGEPGADRVERLLRAARAGRHQVLACSITLMELFYTAIRAQGEDEAFRLVALVKAWPLEWVYPDEKTLLQAGRLKASHRLSVADALVAAVARMRGATLVHKDPEMQALSSEVNLLGLPAPPGNRLRHD